MPKIGIMGGLSAPTLTPFLPDGEVNYHEYERLTAYITQNGVDGVFVCGTSGEFINLTLEERKQLLLTAQRGVKNGAKIMFNITAMNLHDLQELADWAKANDADAVSVTAPYYHGYDAKTLVDYFRKVSKVCGDQALYLYNMSGMTRNPITPTILREVTESCPNVRGIKDSSMDFMTILEYQCAISDPTFEIITGNDAQVLTNLLAGGHGSVIATASVYPALCAQIMEQFRKGDLTAAKAAQTKVLLLRNLYRSIMPIMAHKKNLELLGFQMGPARFPMRDLTEAENERIKSTLQGMGLL